MRELMAEVESIEVVSTPDASLLGGRIDQPKSGGTSDVYALKVAGWVLGKDVRVDAVDVTHRGQTICRLPMNVKRPDVVMRFPRATGVPLCGFEGLVGLVGLDLDFELVVKAVLPDDKTRRLGVIRGRRNPVRSTAQTTIQPLMVTSLGRMGTTWFMRLLAQHPAIVMHDFYPYEFRSATYWLSMLRVLSQPANLLQSSTPESIRQNTWYIGHAPDYRPPVSDDPDVLRWWGKTYVEDLAKFCQESIEGLYGLVAGMQRKRARYFAEKSVPDYIPLLARELYPDTREIFLVRDFRDTFASILAFDAKRGYSGFGRNPTQTDAEYVMRVGRGSRRLLDAFESRRDKVHLVRYEDLAASPAPTLAGVLDHLGVEGDQRTLRRMIKRASRVDMNVRRHRTTSDVQSSVGRWRTDLDADVRALCDEAFGPALEAFGYERS